MIKFNAHNRRTNGVRLVGSLAALVAIILAVEVFLVAPQRQESVDAVPSAEPTLFTERSRLNRSDSLQDVDSAHDTSPARLAMFTPLSASEAGSRRRVIGLDKAAHDGHMPGLQFFHSAEHYLTCTEHNPEGKELNATHKKQLDRMIRQANAQYAGLFMRRIARAQQIAQEKLEHGEFAEKGEATQASPAPPDAIRTHFALSDHRQVEVIVSPDLEPDLAPLLDQEVALAERVYAEIHAFILTNGY